MRRKRKYRNRSKEWKRVQAQVDGARHDVRSVRHDIAPGTSPASLGEVKRSSAEARLVSCPECGYSAGRHSALCGGA